MFCFDVDAAQGPRRRASDLLDASHSLFLLAPAARCRLAARVSLEQHEAFTGVSPLLPGRVERLARVRRGRSVAPDTTEGAAGCQC